MIEPRQLQKLLQFTVDIIGVLDPLVVARTTATYARDLIGCDRCSILARRNDHWVTIAISGQDTVELRSQIVKTITAFVAARGDSPTMILLPDETAAPRPEEVPATPSGPAELVPVPATRSGVDVAYFHNTQMASAAIIPLIDDDERVIGALFCESVLDKFFGEPHVETPQLTPGGRLAEWIGKNSSKALIAANDYRSLPLVTPMRRVRDLTLALMSERRNRLILKTAVISLLVGAVLFWPAMLKVEGNCLLRPTQRAGVVPESAGRLDRILVTEGAAVAPRQILAILDTRRLQNELEIASQEKVRYQSEADRYRAMKDEAGAQIAFVQKQISAHREKRLQDEIEAASLRSPMKGVVLTKDLDLRLGEFLQPGAELIEVAALDQWELVLEVAESDIGLVHRTMQKDGKVGVNFIMYTQSAEVLHGEVTDRNQISIMAKPGPGESMFAITIPSPAIPESLAGQLRPGLTGRAKIEIARRPFIFVLFHNFTHWLRMRWVI